jgi:hypothetical protein
LAGLNKQTGLETENVALLQNWYQKTTQEVTVLNPIEEYQDPSKKHLNYQQAQHKPICLMPSDKRACL